MNHEYYSKKFSSHYKNYDEGLRTYFLKVYNYMVLGLALTSFTAFIISNIPLLFNLFFSTPLRFLILLMPILMSFYLFSRIGSMSFIKAEICFWLFSIIMGMSLSYIPVLYDGECLAHVFFITSATFGTMSLYGYTTKRDLRSMGSFMLMLFCGLFFAMMINFILNSGFLQYVISLVGVVCFTGLTAWDTQIIRKSYIPEECEEVSNKKSIIGALTLYMNFINLFLMLLSLQNNNDD